MKREHLSDALNLISDDIIEETDAMRKINKKYKAMRILRTTVAACLVVAIGIGTAFLLPKIKPNKPEPSINPPENTDLPLLSVSEIVGDGMGFEGYMAHNISELVNSNPWTENCEISTLPVYNNTLNLDERYDITNIDYDKMNSFILDIAKRCGLKENEIEITRDFRAYTDSLFVKTDSFEIRVDPELTADIKVKQPISLPDEYKFTHTNSSYDDMLAVAKYLQKEYNEIIGFKNPQINITGGDYTFDGSQLYNIEFFDMSENLIQNIINYNINRVAFYYEENGNLYMIRIYKPDLSDKIGDYPIITKEAATELLSNGNYITSVPAIYEINMEKISKVELVYRNTHWLDKIYMPYYKFYIELPELEKRFGNGLKHYGIYYVPAVDGKYIKNMPVYDGSFN